MRGAFDFSSWSGIGTTLLGLVLVSLVAVGIRLVFMQTLQRRRERENRQINERLKTLIAAYKTLGSSFTGDLSVDPLHRRDQRLRAQAATAGAGDDAADDDALPESAAERRRRMRDAVEAALSDVILLGTEEQVRLAANAAREMVAGRVVHTAELVASLRRFVREALDLEAIPVDVHIPEQGPLRVASGQASRGRAGGEGGAGGGRGGGGMGGGAGMGMGVGMAGGAGLGHAVGSGQPDLGADAGLR